MGKRYASARKSFTEGLEARSGMQQHIHKFHRELPPLKPEATTPTTTTISDKLLLLPVRSG